MPWSLQFKTSADLFELCKYLLENGANPNCPPSLLAEAINFHSFDVCYLLLEHGANQDSEFEKQVHDFASNHTGSERALHAASRIGSAAKKELLLKYGANLNFLWNNKTAEETGKKYGIQNKTLYEMNPVSSKNFPDDELVLKSVKKLQGI